MADKNAPNPAPEHLEELHATARLVLAMLGEKDAHLQGALRAGGQHCAAHFAERRGPAEAAPS
ncbi:MAG: hypothetical protein MZV70_71665 [Desulfobacterales bacterium]|nr:hypothetical protein [Desulfobacterales bacterium]